MRFWTRLRGLMLEDFELELLNDGRRATVHMLDRSAGLSHTVLFASPSGHHVLTNQGYTRTRAFIG